MLRFFQCSTVFVALTLQTYAAVKGGAVPVSRVPSLEVAAGEAAASGVDEIRLTHLVPSGAVRADSHTGGHTKRLTEADVKEWFLRELNEGGSLSFLNLRKESIEVTRLTNEMGEDKGSFAADQIFFIKGTPRLGKDKKTDKKGNPYPDFSWLQEREYNPRLVFVFKQYNSKRESREEISNLQALKETFKGLDLPKLGFAEYFYQYPDLLNPGHYRYFTLIHPVKGQSLESLLEQYLRPASPEDQQLLKKSLERAFFKLGTVLAHLHLKFMSGGECPYATQNIQHNKELVRKKEKVSGNVMRCSTKIYGDGHLGNIFWDKASGTISFIDIGTLGKKIEAGNYIEELGYIFGTFINMSNSLVSREGKSKEVIDEERVQVVLEFYRAFLRSYLAVFKTRLAGEPYEKLQLLVKKMTLPMAMMRVLGSQPQGDIAAEAWGRITSSLRL